MSAKKRPTAISFEEFVASEQKRIASFHTWWLKQNAIHPNHFPLKMNHGDWNEQLDIYEEGDEDVLID